MTTIAHILAWGEWSTVMMACGHKRRVRKADVKREQMYIGRRVPCPDCGEGRGMALRMERRKA